MKKLSFYLLVAGALLTGSCSDDSIGEQIPDGGTSIPTVSKITSVFTNGTNLSIGQKQSATRGGGSLVVGEEETLCANMMWLPDFSQTAQCPT